MSAGLRLVSLLLAAVIAFAVLHSVQKDRSANFESAAAVGADTVDYYARVNDIPVHCRDARDASACINGAMARDATDVVLWLGNSQLHSINQLKAGEVSSTHTLHALLEPQAKDLLTFSQPNANLQEHLVLFEYLQARLPLSLLVLSLVFDDTRESGLRSDVAALLADDALRQRMANTGIGQALLAAADVSTATDATDSSRKTWQQQSEHALDNWLANRSDLWRQRAEYRARLFYSLYNLRNTVLGISATSKRRKLPGRYDKNVQALEAILRSAAELDIPVLLYIAPIRGDVAIPYVQSEYVDFINTATLLAKRHGARLQNLENLIAPAFWGATGSIGLSNDAAPDIDFMHFKAAGHRVLADTLMQLISDEPGITSQ